MGCRHGGPPGRGHNTGSDWWEVAPGTPCAEPSGIACDHYARYPSDIRLLASLGLNRYRISVEWARIEPAGLFDDAAIDHYRDVVREVHSHGLTPVVTPLPDSPIWAGNIAQRHWRPSARYPEKEILVTEHGIATRGDADRQEFIVRGLRGLQAAMRDGAKVRGYIHWSLAAND